MPTALIINGAEVHEPQASGHLNTLLFETLAQELRSSYTIETTMVADGYDVATEQRKFQRSDLIIFQFPVFWFSVPSSLKQYIDDIYTSPGVFFGHTERYGRGGLLPGKRYMLSMTWNAKASDFGQPSDFLGERTPDDILLPLHLTQQYVGLLPIASFSEHDVVRHPDAEGAVQRLREHMKRYLQNMAEELTV